MIVYKRGMFFCTLIGSVAMILQALFESPSKGAILSYAIIAFILSINDLFSERCIKIVLHIRAIGLVISLVSAIIWFTIDRETLIFMHKHDIVWADSLTISSLSILLFTFGLKSLNNRETYKVYEVLEIIMKHAPGKKVARAMRENTGQSAFILYKNHEGQLMWNTDGNVPPRNPKGLVNENVASLKPLILDSVYTIEDGPSDY
ncbi:hypothetical protein [Paenibacillus sp. FSL K6-2524]|uniref:hypothetical protein n=1 Tax=Paenibacillus sp. FSL K6-2524 TaxID=2954516 RepID=UPI0030F5211F